MQITYDPYDLQAVLVSDGGGTRFVAEQYAKVPMALADYKEGDAKRLRAYQKEISDMTKQIIARKDERQHLLGLHGLDAQGMLQAGNYLKGPRQAAEAMYQLEEYVPQAREVMQATEPMASPEVMELVVQSDAELRAQMWRQM
jgi:hypothetical protein